MIKVGFLSVIMAEKGLDEVLEFAVINNFGCVEVACWPEGKAERRYAGVSHIDVDRLQDEQEVAKLRQLSESTVPISALGYYPNILTDDQAQARIFIEHLKKVIKAAQLLGVDRVSTFIGREHTKSTEYNFGKFTEIWPEIISYAESLKVQVCIENCPMYFSADEWPGGKNLASSPAMWDRIFTKIPSGYFGLNFDPSHFIWQQMDYIQPLYDFAEKIFHLHLKDVKLIRHKLNKVGIRAHPLEFHSPKLPGLGDVNWGDFFSALNSIGYSGPACIEMEDKAYESSEELVRLGLLQSFRYVKQFNP